MVQPDWKLKGQKETKIPLSNISLTIEEITIIGIRKLKLNINICADLKDKDSFLFQDRMYSNASNKLELTGVLL